MPKDVKRQTRQSRSPTEWASEALIYSRGTVAQLRDLPLTEDERYPGFNDRWGYRKDVVPVAIDGIIQNDGLWSRNWLQGLDTFFFGYAGLNPVDFAAMVADTVAYWTGRVSDDDASKIVTDTDVDVVSNATHIMTCPANRARKVREASIRDDTRAPTYSLAYTPNGGTASVTGSGTTFGIGDTHHILGGNDGNGLSVMAAIKGPLWIQAGDTIEISIDNFVGGDVVRKEFVFEEYIV